MFLRGAADELGLAHQEVLPRFQGWPIYISDRCCRLPRIGPFGSTCRDHRVVPLIFLRRCRCTGVGPGMFLRGVP
jgi:hypothetical protein